VNKRETRPRLISSLLILELLDIILIYTLDHRPTPLLKTGEERQDNGDRGAKLINLIVKAIGIPAIVDTHQKVDQEGYCFT
jgi:hypothetical protein